MRLAFIFTVALSFILVTGCLLMKSKQQKQQITFLCGAGMKAPVTDIVETFERETGIKVQTVFDGSSTLREYIIEFNSGDVFLPGDKANLDVLQEKRLIKKSSFLAWHVVAILVAPELKEEIKSIDDLAKDGIRLAISNPRLASLGRVFMDRIISSHPLEKDILRNVVVYGSSSQDVLDLYREGEIDAILEWDVMAATKEGQGLVVVPIAEQYRVKDELRVGLLTTSKNSDLARKFYDYLLTYGKDFFRKYGYNIDPNLSNKQENTPQMSI